VIVVWTTFYTVEADEVAVVQRFGRYVRREAPGLHSRSTLGLETVRKVKVQRLWKSEFGFRTEEPGVPTRFSPQAFPEDALMLAGDLSSTRFSRPWRRISKRSKKTPAWY
jgi:membrane protease subunit HflK